MATMSFQYGIFLAKNPSTDDKYLSIIQHGRGKEFSVVIQFDNYIFILNNRVISKLEAF